MRVDFQRLRFLVAEDNAPMRKMLHVLLQGLGAREIHEAEDGAAAFDAFVAHHPDIVLTDWEMPRIDGIGLTRLIRDRAKSPNPFAPIVMISAHCEKGRVLEARDAGVNEFLVKPVGARTLYERVLGIVASPRPFIRTNSYFGPDHRRPAGADPEAPQRGESTADAMVRDLVREAAAAGGPRPAGTRR